MTDTLSVYYHGDVIGKLTITKGRRYIFSYTEEWLDRGDAIPISISLPLRPDEFDEETSMSFFSNLLPDSLIKEKIAKRFKISEEDTYGLLELIGGEVAGALSIIPNGKGLEENGEYEEIPHEQLGELLSSISEKPFLAGEEGVRLSLAGAQDKLPIYFEDGKFYLPKGNKPSTHIIKTAISDKYPYSVINEAFCMKLAKEAGLPVPEVDIIRDAHEPFFLIERYDRVQDDQDEIVRLHQEDFCQALSVVPEEKYEANGGPSLFDCFNLVGEYCANPAVDKLSLLKWVMFNILIGNADAHAKNLSLLYIDGEINLAPFYDILCTDIYPNLDKSLSMKIGGRKKVRYLSVHDWSKLAGEIGVKFSIFPDLREEILNDLGLKIKSVKEMVISDSKEEEFIASIETVIQERSRILSSIK